MSRRGFLALLAGGLAAALGAYAFAWGDPTRIVVAILRRRLGFLKVEDGVFEVFSREYVASRPENRRQLSMLAVVAWPTSFVTVYRFLPMGHPVRRLEDNVVTRFLMSTDFFQHYADQSRNVRYLAFYDPPGTACQNFVARVRDRQG